LQICHVNSLEFLGVFEHFYSENFFNNSAFGTHYIALCYHFILDVDRLDEMKFDEQHTSFQWFPSYLLLSDPNVHVYSKNYYDALKQPKL